MAEITITTEASKTEAEEIAAEIAEASASGLGNGKEQKSLKVNVR